MSTIRARKLAKRKRRIERRLRDRAWEPQDRPMFAAANIQYELADKTRGLSAGGIGLMHRLARRVGLIDEIDRRLHLLKLHLPYHESDHVLNIAYNLLAGGQCLDDLELRRNDEVYLDALGAQRIPDPTTAGDFCRRFDVVDVHILMSCINAARQRVWREQPKSFFDLAIIDVDGAMTPTGGECKQGMDISYKGEWGYYPLLVSLHNTREVLFIVNRSGNRPSYEGASAYLDQAAELCLGGGFKKVLLRGDTDFTQTRHLDRWDDGGVQFVFGVDAQPNLVEYAENLPESAWKRLERRAKHTVKTQPRRRPANVKEQVVRARQFENIRLASEDVAEFAYRPGLCRKLYRLVVVRKNLSVEKGEQVLFDDVRYFFYITNVDSRSASDVVYTANGRCDQENLIAQLKGGVRAMTAPVDNLVSNWAYMVMASLAWTLKSWLALCLPENGRWADKHRAEKQTVLRMEFKRFLHAFMLVPCQIARQSRRVVYRLLSWNPWQGVFLRAVDAVSLPMRC
ncbi:MAG: IS1380 family transposase [Planctomycetes bacterium]|nr:IS1380 family transposase [Planctomycetota bacterium]